MKAIVALLLTGAAVVAQAQDRLEPQAPVSADTSFKAQSRPEPVQLPDVNEQDEPSSPVVSFAGESQNQALMLGGLLAMGFLVRRRREG